MLIRNAILFIAIELVCVLRTFSEPQCQTQESWNFSRIATPQRDVIDVFAATFYTSLVYATDPRIVFGMRWPAKVASKILYDTDTRVFTEIGLRHFKHGVEIAARAVGLVEPFTLPVYFKNAAYCVADFLIELDMLTCENAVGKGLNFAVFTVNVLKKLDKTRLSSYIEAVVRGIGMILRELGFDLKEMEKEWDHLAVLFYLDYKKETVNMPYKEVSHVPYNLHRIHKFVDI